MAEQKVTIVGCAYTTCRRCQGRGHYGVNPETGEVTPCDCVTYFDLDYVRRNSSGEPDTDAAFRTTPLNSTDKAH